ncbi:amino acid kinase family protein, partial [Salinibacter ruber]
MPDRSFSSTECASRPVRVLKFGGTSVGSADGIKNAVRLVHAATETCRPVVVVS